MSDSTGNAPPPRSIWKATVGAVIVAALFLFIVIRAPDRSAATSPVATTSETPAAGAAATAAGEPNAEPAAAPADDLAAIMEGNIRAAEEGVQKSYPSAYKSDVVKIAMAPSEEVEFKAHMQPGDTLVYSWTSPQPLYVDMHGEPFTYPEEPAVRYEELDGVSSGNGWVTATFPGKNGWFWLNTSEESIIIELKVSGFYEELEEVYRKAP